MVVVPKFEHLKTYSPRRSRPTLRALDSDEHISPSARTHLRSLAVWRSRLIGIILNIFTLRGIH
jgi:hypothetical protein